MPRYTPWLLLAALAAGCAASPMPPAGLTLEAESPTYSIQKTWVMPHVLETSGLWSAKSFAEIGTTYEAGYLTRDGEFHRLALEDFTVTLTPTNPKTGALAVFPDGKLHVTMAADSFKLLADGRDDDCDGLDADFDGVVDKGLRSDRLVLMLKGQDGTVTKLQFYCPTPSGNQRTVGAGVVSDIIEFAGMAINEQGVPTKAGKKAKKAAKKAK